MVQPGVAGLQAGITYCFLTPVFLAILLVFGGGVHGGTLNIIAFVGLGFGLVNLVTWFVLMPASWWMGVLRLPLVILSVTGLLAARHSERKAAQGSEAALT